MFKSQSHNLRLGSTVHGHQQGAEINRVADVDQGRVGRVRIPKSDTGDPVSLEKGLPIVVIQV